MKSITFLFTFLFYLPISARSFDITQDGLCFKNYDPVFREFGILGTLARKEGICQGMTGLVSAFYEHATFSPHQPKLTTSETIEAIEELRRYHSGACKLSRKVEIKGYKNLNEFCRDHKKVFMAQTIDYNADIAIREISWKLDELFIIKNKKMVSSIERFRLHQQIESLRKKLSLGRWPLMLYYKHVIGVYAISDQYKNGKLHSVILKTYDSNYSSPSTYLIEYDLDGLPKAGYKMIWDTTPSRLTTMCW
jgi:hypothetical protein